MTKKGVWDLQGVRDEYLQENWTYEPNAPAPENNEFFSIGRNDRGALGQNDNIRRSSPVQIPGTSWKYVATGSQHSGAIRNDGTLWAFGSNSSGRLGQNDQTNYSSPVQIPGTQWARIHGGRFDGFAALKTDNTLWTWGVNGYGTLGQNSTVPYSSPIQIPGTQWDLEKMSVGDQEMMAIKTDGTLWAWGFNAYGQLGQNNAIWYSSPVQIPGTQWSDVDIGTSNAFAIKTDGTLWAWGTNSNGQLGQNDQTRYSSPVQIPGTTWSSISVNDTTLIATKTDNTLWGFGNNGDGQLGQNNTTQYSSPIQIPGNQWQSNPRVAKGYTGYRHNIVLKTDGTAWTWGSNAYGQLGQNNQTSYSSPVQIPGTQWSYGTAGPHTLLLKEYS